MNINHTENPKARINVHLNSEQDNSSLHKELPLSLLCIGNFGGNQPIDSIGSLKKIPINTNNFNESMKKIKPCLHLSIANKIQANHSNLNVSLEFNSIKSFSPDKIAENVPELRKLLAMRNLLKDLKSNLIDNLAFKKGVQKIISSSSACQQLKKELETINNTN